MSIHTDRAYRAAQKRGAAAAISYETWNSLVTMPKRELAEIAMHLAALATGHYDVAIAGGSIIAGKTDLVSALDRLLDERQTLKANGLI